MKKYFSVLSIVLGLFSCSKKDKYYNISNENINTLWNVYNVGDTLVLKNQNNQLITLQVRQKERAYEDRGGNGFMHKFEIAYLIFKVISPGIMKDNYLLISFHGNLGLRDDFNLIFYEEIKTGNQSKFSSLQTHFAIFDWSPYSIETSAGDLLAKDAVGTIQINPIDKMSFSGKEYSQVQGIRLIESKNDQLVQINDRGFYFNETGILRLQLNGNEYWAVN